MNALNYSLNLELVKKVIRNFLKMSLSKAKELLKAEDKALNLFRVAETRGLIIAGKTERELNTELFDLAFELYGIKKFWHKRIVRSGKNTLYPYKENPPDLTIQNSTNTNTLFVYSCTKTYKDILGHVAEDLPIT